MGEPTSELFRVLDADWRTGARGMYRQLRQVQSRRNARRLLVESTLTAIAMAAKTGDAEGIRITAELADPAVNRRGPHADFWDAIDELPSYDHDYDDEKWHIVDAIRRGADQYETENALLRGELEAAREEINRRDRERAFYPAVGGGDFR